MKNIFIKKSIYQYGILNKQFINYNNLKLRSKVCKGTMNTFYSRYPKLLHSSELKMPIGLVLNINTKTFSKKIFHARISNQNYRLSFKENIKAKK